MDSAGEGAETVLVLSGCAGVEVGVGAEVLALSGGIAAFEGVDKSELGGIAETEGAETLVREELVAAHHLCPSILVSAVCSNDCSVLRSCRTS